MPVATDRPRRHAVAAALVAAAVLATTGYAAIAAGAVSTVSAARRSALLGNRAQVQRSQLAALSQRQVDTALTGSPLSQRLVNVAAVRAIDAGAAPASWLAQVGRLGWRDTASLQNILIGAVRAGNFRTILDGSDALLRRRELTEQVVPALMLLELVPALREQLTARLAAQANWRAMYLTTFAGLLATPAQIEARAALLRTLDKRGGVARGEATANVKLFDVRGRPDLAFALWRQTQPKVTRPLNDVRFVRAARSFRIGEEAPVAFEWEVLSGGGYSAGASEEGGRTRLDIDWDGRGVPVFARQRTSATPGRYSLDVQIAKHKRADLSALSFRLLCGNGPVRLRAVAPGRYVTDASVPCGYPVLEIAGDIQPGAVAHQVAIEALILRPLPRAG